MRMCIFRLSLDTRASVHKRNWSFLLRHFIINETSIGFTFWDFIACCVQVLSRGCEKGVSPSRVLRILFMIEGECVMCMPGFVSCFIFSDINSRRFSTFVLLRIYDYSKYNKCKTNFSAKGWQKCFLKLCNILMIIIIQYNHIRWKRYVITTLWTVKLDLFW